VLAVAVPMPAALTWAVPLLAALLVAAGFRAGRTPGSRAPFRAVIGVALLAVLLLLASGTVLR
jgi:hypothetical protein